VFLTPPLPRWAKVLLKDIILPTKSNRILHVEFVVSTLLFTNTQTHWHDVIFSSRTTYALFSRTGPVFYVFLPLRRPHQSQKLLLLHE